MDQVCVGFIGAGFIASQHVGKLLQFEDVTIAAIADSVLVARKLNPASRRGCRSSS
jgi:hypothetical protein